MVHSAADAGAGGLDARGCKNGTVSEEPAVETFADGTVSATGSLVDGLKHGPWTTFNRAGGIKATGQFDRGQMSGYWEWFREDGSRMRSGHFSNGEQSGEWITWDRAGNAVTRKNFS